jgi:hypothetical protein
MTAITSKTFTHAPVLDIPRGARVAADVFTAALRLASGLFRASTSARVRRTRADEAADVREMASRWERTDPGFAADLYAAAARHEGLND